MFTSYLLTETVLCATAGLSLDDGEVLFIAGVAAVVTVIASSRLVAARNRKRRTTWVRPLSNRRSEYGT